MTLLRTEIIQQLIYRLKRKISLGGWQFVIFETNQSAKVYVKGR